MNSGAGVGNSGSLTRGHTAAPYLPHQLTQGTPPQAATTEGGELHATYVMSAAEGEAFDTPTHRQSPCAAASSTEHENHHRLKEQSMDNAVTVKTSKTITEKRKNKRKKKRSNQKELVGGADSDNEVNEPEHALMADTKTEIKSKNRAKSPSVIQIWRNKCRERKSKAERNNGEFTLSKYTNDNAKLVRKCFDSEKQQPSGRNYMKRGSAAVSAGSAREMTNHFCPKCSKVMMPPANDPMLLIPCGHSLCRHCISETVSLDEEDGEDNNSRTSNDHDVNEDDDNDGDDDDDDDNDDDDTLPPSLQSSVIVTHKSHQDSMSSVQSGNLLQKPPTIKIGDDDTTAGKETGEGVSKGSCPLCSLSVQSVVCNVMLMQIIQDFQTRRKSVWGQLITPGRGEPPNADMYSHQTVGGAMDASGKLNSSTGSTGSIQDSVDHVTSEYHTLCIKYEALQDEADSVVSSMETLSRLLIRSGNQLERLTASEQKVEADIHSLQLQLCDIRRHKNECTHKCETLETSHFEEANKLASLQQVLQEIEKNIRQLRDYIAGGSEDSAHRAADSIAAAAAAAGDSSQADEGEYTPTLTTQGERAVKTTYYDMMHDF